MAKAVCFWVVSRALKLAVARNKYSWRLVRVVDAVTPRPTLAATADVEGDRG